MTPRTVLFAAFLMAATLQVTTPAGAANCRKAEFRGIGYSLCETVAGKDDLRLFLNDGTGRPWGSFTRINKVLAEKGQKLSFAMNAGMFHPDRTPVGLYVESGKMLIPLADGGNYGNFGLKPNGVFCIMPTSFSVTETLRFRRERPACIYATQSGPMLVIAGRIHPRFLASSTSRHIRNGVGVSPDGKRAVFVISDIPVTFHEFASFFRDSLGLRDALYFDGKVSRLHAPSLGRSDSGLFPLGPIIGTVEQAREHVGLDR